MVSVLTHLSRCWRDALLSQLCLQAPIVSFLPFFFFPSSFFIFLLFFFLPPLQYYKFSVNKSKQPLTPNISAIPNFLQRGAAHGIFLVQKNFEMFPLQPALTGGQGSSQTLHKMFRLPFAQLWL